MSKYRTPGPWVVDESNPNLVARLVNGVYEYVCAVEPSSFSDREYSREQEESDARLIAAAPELLTALKGAGLFLHHAWCDIQMNDYSFEKLNQVMTLVDSVIAKAEGKE